MFFFFNDTATTEIYTLSLHDALPIWWSSEISVLLALFHGGVAGLVVHARGAATSDASRSEEHTSELQSQSNLVCRLLLEKKKTTHTTHAHPTPSTSRTTIHTSITVPN